MMPAPIKREDAVQTTKPLQGSYRGYIGIVSGLYWDYIEAIQSHIGIMEKKLETTVVYSEYDYQRHVESASRTESCQ